MPFSGVFDGNGHVLSNFTYAISKGEPAHTAKPWAIRDVGMFRYVFGESAEIKNLGLIDPNVGPASTFAGAVQNVGALVGRLYGGSITNCWVEGGRVSAHCHAGGLIGVAYEGTISRCHVQCRVACSQVEVDRLADSGDRGGSALLAASAGSSEEARAAMISRMLERGHRAGTLRHRRTCGKPEFGRGAGYPTGPSPGGSRLLPVRGRRERQGRCGRSHRQDGR